MLSKSPRRICFVAKIAVQVVDREGPRDVGASLGLEEEETESHGVKHIMYVTFSDVDCKIRWAMAFMPAKSTDVRAVARLVPF